MNRQRNRQTWLLVLLGFTGGLSLGLSLVVVALLTGFAAVGPERAVPEVLLHATATHGSDTMAIATGSIDEGVEGFFVLDFLTGELTCQVLNPRTGELGGVFRRNVAGDLGLEHGKQPKLLMVTGRSDLVYSGNVRPAESFVYVADANTGRYVAYMLPWDRTRAVANFGQVNTMIPVGAGTARRVAVE
jgi:hypothetical protein